MKWIKIKLGQLIPKEDLLVTDGKQIGIKYQGFLNSQNPHIKNWTHYILLSSLELPKDQ